MEVTSISVSSFMGNVGDTKTSTCRSLTQEPNNVGENDLTTILASTNRKIQYALEQAIMDTSTNLISRVSFIFFFLFSYCCMTKAASQ